MPGETAILWNEPMTQKLHIDAVDDGNGELLKLEGKFGTLTLQAVGLADPTATLTFQASIDGTNFVNLAGVNLASGVVSVSTISTDGIFSFSVSGLNYFRAVVSSHSKNANHKVNVTAVCVVGSPVIMAV